MIECGSYHIIFNDPSLRIYSRGLSEEFLCFCFCFLNNKEQQHRNMFIINECLCDTYLISF